MHKIENKSFYLRKKVTIFTVMNEKYVFMFDDQTYKLGNENTTVYYLDLAKLIEVA